MADLARPIPLSAAATEAFISFRSHLVLPESRSRVVTRHGPRSSTRFLHSLRGGGSPKPPPTNSQSRAAAERASLRQEKPKVDDILEVVRKARADIRGRISVNRRKYPQRRCDVAKRRTAARGALHTCLCSLVC